MEEQQQEGRLFLVAVDESATSMDAFETACKMLKKGDKLRIIHIKDFQKGGSFDPLYNIDVQVWNFAEEEKAKKLEEYYTQTCIGKKLSNFTYDTIQSFDAREAICNEVEKLKPFLLIMGSRGLSTLQKWMLGSVSDYCSQKYAQCSVMIVKGKQPKE